MPPSGNDSPQAIMEVVEDVFNRRMTEAFDAIHDDLEKLRATCEPYQIHHALVAVAFKARISAR